MLLAAAGARYRRRAAIVILGSGQARLAVAPKALGSIEELRQEVGSAEGAGKAEADCMHLGTQIEPIMLSNDDGLGIDWHDSREKEVRRDTSVTWRWDIHASQSGLHYQEGRISPALRNTSS